MWPMQKKGHIRKDCSYKDKPWYEIHPTSGEKDKKMHWSGKNKKLQPVTYCKSCKRWRFDDSGGHLPGAAHEKFVKKNKDRSATAPAASSGNNRGNNRGGRRNGGRRVTFAQVAKTAQEEEEEESVYSDSYSESQADDSNSDDFCSMAIAT